LVSVGAFQVTSPFFLDWSLVGGALGGDTFDLFEFRIEFGAWNFFI
jgi:hypothetical protein